jgi:hypothetical protein
MFQIDGILHARSFAMVHTHIVLAIESCIAEEQQKFMKICLLDFLYISKRQINFAYIDRPSSKL